VRHVAGVAVALLCGALAARVPLHVWAGGLAMKLWLISMLLLVATFLSGLEAKGAQRWLAIPGLPFAIQPAELARLATPLAVAALLANATPKSLASWALLQRVAFLVVPPVALMLLQPDFGGAVMLCAVVGFVLFAAGLPLRTLALPGGIAAAGVAFYVAVRPYAQARVRGFIDPWQSAHDEGFQLVQSFVAFGRGGSTGVGLGNSLQKLFYLPEAHTDFILSVVAEEVGLVGVLGVLGGFAALCWAGLRIARHARQPFPLLVATACTALVIVPALCNAAVVMGLLPTKGLTLPFLSHGSNSLVCTALAVGILLRAGREPNAPLQRAHTPPTRRLTRA
jgi:cell division protein FtsW